MTSPPRQLILGPQRPELVLGRAMNTYELDRGRIGVISAGWQEAEGDIDDIGHEIKRPVNDLGIYQHCNVLFAKDQDLYAAYLRRQERLSEQQRLYRIRLRQLALAVRQVLGAEGSKETLAAERRHAISQLRALDRHHQHRVNEVHADFNRRFNAETSDVLATHIRIIREELEQTDTVIITGGNLLTLINRLRLLGLYNAFSHTNIVAWSAGAMLLADGIVLFHDRMPQGLRDAEIVDDGMSILPAAHLFPDARNRLRTGNRLRMGSVCRRFSPSTCYLLNSGSQALFEQGKLIDAHAVHYPTRNGNIELVTVQ